MFDLVMNASQLPVAPPRGPTRVLVVDDVPEICELYRAIFARIAEPGVELTLETDARAAVRLLRSTAFDLVISDFRMPGADGVDVLCAARKRAPNGRRVMMTGYNEIPASIGRLRSARVDAYLQKPLKMHELIITLSRLVRGEADALAGYRTHALELEAAAARDESPEVVALSARARPGIEG